MLVSSSCASLATMSTQCQPSFYSYGFRPYPDLPAEFEAVFHPYEDKGFIGADNSARIASWTNLRSISPDHYLSLPLNLPHYYQVPSIFGYDPVVEGQPRMLEVFSACRTIRSRPAKRMASAGICLATAQHPFIQPNQVFALMEQTVNFEAVYRRLAKENFIPRAESTGTRCWKCPESIRWHSNRPARIAVANAFKLRGADIDVTGLPAVLRVTVNFLYYPQMHGMLSGKPLAVEHDDWQHITITLPESGQTLKVRFEPPWLETCAIGLVLCLLGLGMARLCFAAAHP